MAKREFPSVDFQTEKQLLTLRLEYKNLLKAEYAALARAKEKLQCKHRAQGRVMVERINRLLPPHLTFNLSDKGMEERRIRYVKTAMGSGVDKELAWSEAEDDEILFDHWLEEAYYQLREFAPGDNASTVGTAERDDAILSARPKTKRRNKKSTKSTFKQKRAA